MLDSNPGQQDQLSRQGSDLADPNVCSRCGAPATIHSAYRFFGRTGWEHLCIACVLGHHLSVPRLAGRHAVAGPRPEPRRRAAPPRRGRA